MHCDNAFWKNVYKLRYTTNTMVSFFATSTVVSCAQRKRKNMYNAELFEREDFIRQFVKLHPGEIGLSFRMSSLKTWNYLILCKSALCEKIVRFKPPSQKKCHIYFGYNNSHLRFRGFRKNKWMTFVVLSGWGFEANSVEL